MSLGYSAGNEINYNPPGNQGPGPVDVSAVGGSLEVKPLRAIDLRNNYVYTHFTQPETGALSSTTTSNSSHAELPGFPCSVLQPNWPIRFDSSKPRSDQPFQYEVPLRRRSFHLHAPSGHRNLRRLHRQLREFGSRPLHPGAGRSLQHQRTDPSTATGPLMNDGKTIYISSATCSASSPMPRIGQRRQLRKRTQRSAGCDRRTARCAGR